ncbi:MAG: class I SAM-dependent methyltransferase [Gammaproteobacteria bacterium]
MERVTEPELMDEHEQAKAYAEADFETPHNAIIEQFATAFPRADISGPVLDLGCGPADISVRFARRYPGCTVDGVDGAEAMLAFGRERVASERLGERVRLYRCFLPDDPLPHTHYATIISNSLLHHLHDPHVLWSTVARVAQPPARVFIADLMRPVDDDTVQALVTEHANDEPEVLQRDFYNSLRAAFTVTEVTEQLTEAGLASLAVQPVSDRHLIVSGVIETATQTHANKHK